MTVYSDQAGEARTADRVRAVRIRLTELVLPSDINSTSITVRTFANATHRSEASTVCVLH